MTRTFKTGLLFSIASTALAVSAPAFAQDAPAAEEGDSDVIIVRARLREEKLVDVPLAVTVATAAQLARDQINSVNDLQRVTPALEISSTSGGETNGGGRLRGLGTGVFNPSVASSVAFVIDQVPTGNLSYPQLFDMAQVEVLRGPQGTLFGQGASAGVINITTVAPTTEKVGASGSVSFADKGTAGSEVGELVVNGAFNLPVGDKAAFRVATQYKTETGLQRSVTTGKDNKITDFGVRVRALLMPSETFTVNLTGEYAKETNAGQTFFAIAIAPNSTTPFGPPGGTLGGLSTAAYTSTAAGGCAMPVIDARAEYYCEAIPTAMNLSIGGVSAVVDWELGDNLKLTSVSGYKERTFNQFTRDFSRITPNQAARQERTQENSRGFSQELRLSYISDAFDLVTGAYYSDFRFDRVPTGTGPYAFGVNTQGNRIGFSVCPATGIGFCPVPTSFTKETTTNSIKALFADTTIKLAETIEFFGGLRYDDYTNTTRFGTDTTATTGSIKVDDGNLSGRAGLSFKPNENTNIYGSYSRGYKPPAVGTSTALIVPVTNPSGTFTLKPEISDAFELGVKASVGRVQLSANAFYNTIANFQSQVSTFVGTALISKPINVAKVTSKGFELTAFGRAAPGLNLNVGYQFNVVEFPAGYIGDDGISLAGTQFLNAPKHKVTLSADYAVPVGNTLEVFANANVVYKSSVLLAARGDPRYRYPAHEIVNIGFGVRDQDGGWNASVFVRNLTKEREPTAYLASTFAGQADGGIRAWPVAGLTARVVGVRAGFDF